VRLTKTYYLGETEVTQAQWKSVMGSDGTPSPYAGDDLPVSGVTWQEAVDFCRKLSERPEERSAGRVYRLPTEAEWEFACRAGTSTPFSFGETIDSDQANYDADFIYGTGKKGLTRQRPCPCGSLPANAWGLREMHGNAWEWCSDFYSRDTYSARVDSANQVQVDPTGPPGGMAYVVRGGAWSSNPAEIRSASRTNYGPTYRQVLVGLRLCMDAP